MRKEYILRGAAGLRDLDIPDADPIFDDDGKLIALWSKEVLDVRREEDSKMVKIKPVERMSAKEAANVSERFSDELLCSFDVSELEDCYREIDNASREGLYGVIMDYRCRDDTAYELRGQGYHVVTVFDESRSKFLTVISWMPQARS